MQSSDLETYLNFFGMDSDENLLCRKLVHLKMVDFAMV